jgi:hypothetical protein
MDKKDFVALTTQIAQNLSNQALVTDLLTKINEGFENVYTTSETLQEKTKGFEDKIKGLQETNMNLFLKVSHPTPDEKLGSPEPLKYEDLITSFEGGK